MDPAVVPGRKPHDSYMSHTLLCVDAQYVGAAHVHITHTLFHCEQLMSQADKGQAGILHISGRKQQRSTVCTQMYNFSVICEA